MLIEIPAATDGNLRWINPAYVKTAIASVDERPPGTFEAHVELRTDAPDHGFRVALGGYPTHEEANDASREFISRLSY